MSRTLSTAARAALALLLLCLCSVLGCRPRQGPVAPRIDSAFMKKLRTAPGYGPKDAPIQLVAFGDPTKLEWRGVYRMIRDLLGEEDDLLLIYLALPQPKVRGADMVARALIAAHRQGRFWAMHDQVCLYPELRSEQEMLRLARWTGLDLRKFSRAMDAPSTRAELKGIRAMAEEITVLRTPALLLNGRRVAGVAELPLALAQERNAVARLLASGVVRALVAERRILERRSDPADAGIEDTGPPDMEEPSEGEEELQPPPRSSGDSPPMTPGDGTQGSPLPISGSPARGAAEAMVTVVAFADLVSPFYAELQPVIARLMDAFPEDLRLVIKHFPLPHHPMAPMAAEAAQEAHSHGSFWPMHDRLVALGSRLSREQILTLAVDQDLDAEQMALALNDGRHRARVQEDVSLGRSLRVRASPTLFINGQRVEGVRPFDELEDLVKAELEEANRLRQNGVALSDLHGTRVRAALEAEALRLAHLPSARRTVVRASKIFQVPLNPTLCRGPFDAAVTVVEFLDPARPAGGELGPLVDELVREGGGLRQCLRLVPAPGKNGSSEEAAAILAEAAAQGRLGPYLTRLRSLKPPLMVAGLGRVAQQAGVDKGMLAAALRDGRHQTRIEEDRTLAEKFGLARFPTFFVNGIKLGPRSSEAEFREVLVEARRRAEALIQAGTPRARVYDTLVQFGHTGPSPIPSELPFKLVDPRAVHAVPVKGRPALGASEPLVTIV